MRNYSRLISGGSIFPAVVFFQVPLSLPKCPLPSAMMCTAAVCQLGPSTHFKRYEEGEELALNCETPYPANSAKGQWRSFTSSDIATFMLRFSPASDSLSRFLSPPANNSQPFDVLSSLPVEISLFILSFLPPQDLCLACRVCKRWYTLCNDRSLLKKRTDYVDDQRIKYQRSKENYNNGTYQSSRPAFVRHASTPVLSPVNSKELLSRSEPRHSSVAPPISPAYSNGRTPAPSFTSMINGVENLTIDGNATDIRRCLFPEFDTLKKLGPRPYVGGRVPITDMVIGRKSNKSRLRRL